MLKDFLPVPVFNESTLKKMKKIEWWRKRGWVAYYCKDCNYATPRKADLVNHSRTHSGERPFECGICDRKFSHKVTLTKHLLTHQEGRFKCDQCDYKATQKGTLVLHLLTHSGVKPYKCDRCEFSATRKGDLVIHSRRHTGERPFSCTHCSYKCTTSSYLTVHMRIEHTGEKPYACAQCSYESVQKGNLDRHKFMHSGAKPFNCDYCPFKTSDTSIEYIHVINCMPVLNAPINQHKRQILTDMYADSYRIKAL